MSAIPPTSEIDAFLSNSDQIVNLSTEIDAPAELCWKTMAQIGLWIKWRRDDPKVKLANPKQIDKPLSVGDEASWAAGGFTCHGLIVESVQGKVFTWNGKAVHGCLDGMHRFTFETLPSGKCKVTTWDRAGGCLSPLVAKKLLIDENTNYLADLKAYCESNK